MFALQKILARVFFPLPIVFWLAGAAGIAAWYRRPRLARRLATGAVVWLFLISWNPVGDTLLGTLEGRHAPLAQAPPDVTHIVVLGGGAHAEETRHASVRLSRSTQGRVLEGVRLWRAAASSRASGIPRLIFTGDSPDGRRPMASLAAEAARDLGVPPDRIVMLDQTYNTEQEARAVAQFLLPPREEQGRIVLVTSASHMSRAVMLFRRAGLDPVPAPAHFLTDSGSRSSWSFLPEAGALTRTETFVYEIMGLLWALVRGR